MLLITTENKPQTVKSLFSEKPLLCEKCIGDLNWMSYPLAKVADYRPNIPSFVVLPTMLGEGSYPTFLVSVVWKFFWCIICVVVQDEWSLLFVTISVMFLACILKCGDYIKMPMPHTMENMEQRLRFHGSSGWYRYQNLHKLSNKLPKQVIYEGWLVCSHTPAIT